MSWQQLPEVLKTAIDRYSLAQAVLHAARKRRDMILSTDRFIDMELDLVDAQEELTRRIEEYRHAL